MLNFWPILRVHLFIGFMLIKKMCITIIHIENYLRHSWFNVHSMPSTASTCFYEIIQHRVQPKFGVECSSVNSCNCFMNLKKEKNEQNMAHRHCT